jgi:N-acetyl-1-D-myo-inositol-2-amino-2-deoxy-alpha-D-glucopyranoside deacetylase
MGAVEAAADAAYRPELGPAWSVAKVYWSAVPRSVMQAGLDALAESGASAMFEGVVDADELPFVVPDDVVAAEIDGRAWHDRKSAAMRAHATQITVDGPFFALSNNLGQEVLGIEHFRLVRGERGPAGAGPQGWEDDLFSGLDG